MSSDVLFENEPNDAFDVQNRPTWTEIQLFKSTTLNTAKLGHFKITINPHVIEVLQILTFTHFVTHCGVG